VPTRSRFFGQFLLERGLITPQALLEALAIQEQVNAPIGTLAVRQGLLTPENVAALHREQRTEDLRLGELAIRHGLLDADQTAALLAEQRRTHTRLGEALVRIGALTREDLARELDAFERAEAAHTPPHERLEPHSALIERTLRLTQTLFLRLAHVTVKLGEVGAAPSFSHVAMADIGAAHLYLACGDAVARVITCGMLGFEPADIDPADMNETVAEFLSALATQLGGTAPARVVSLPNPLPAKARLFELHTAEESLALIFDPS
jgi:hypothetical protein